MPTRPCCGWFNARRYSWLIRLRSLSYSSIRVWSFCSPASFSFTKRVFSVMIRSRFSVASDQGEEVIYANQALLRMFQCGTMEEFRAFTGNSFRGMVYPEDLEEDLR